MKRMIPYFWLVVLALLLMLFAFGKSAKIKLSSVMMIGVHIAIPIAISLVHDKKATKKYEEYRREFVKNIDLNLSEFGSLGFEHDTNTGILTLISGFLPEISGAKISEITIEGYNGNISPVINCLRYIYDSKDKIITMCLSCVKETYEDENIVEYGEELITDDFILKHITFYAIDMIVQNDAVTAVVIGYMNTDIEDHISEHGFNVHIFADGRIELE